MTQPRASSAYGVPFLGNAIPVGDPRTAASFVQGNRAWDDTAQMTRVSSRAWVQFNTSTSAALPLVIVPTAGHSQMGVANTNLPVVTKTATGLYTITYPASWTDGAGTDGTGVGQVEAIVLVSAEGQVQSTSFFGRVQCSCLNQTISCAVLSNVSGTDTLSDLAPTTTIASSSNSTPLPAGTIDVVSTAGFPPVGSILINGLNTAVAYIGIVGNSFTGCSGGTGTLATGQVVGMSPGVQLFVICWS